MLHLVGDFALFGNSWPGQRWVRGKTNLYIHTFVLNKLKINSTCRNSWLRKKYQDCMHKVKLRLTVQRKFNFFYHSKNNIYLLYPNHPGPVCIIVNVQLYSIQYTWYTQWCTLGGAGGVPSLLKLLFKDSQSVQHSKMPSKIISKYVSKRMQHFGKTAGVVRVNQRHTVLYEKVLGSLSLHLRIKKVCDTFLCLWIRKSSGNEW